MQYVANMSSGGVIHPVAHEFLCGHFNPIVRSCRYSSGTATLDTGGLLSLTRQGLSPCKLMTSFLGALGICFKINRWFLPAFLPAFLLL